MNIINGKPVKAFLEQDHEAHIAVHTSFMQDPEIQAMVGQSSKASLISGAMEAHIAEHIAFQYRIEIEKQLGVPLPPVEEPLPMDIENEVARLTAEASGKVLQSSQQKAQQEEQQKQQEDPILQMQKQELEIKQQESQADHLTKSYPPVKYEPNWPQKTITTAHPHDNRLVGMLVYTLNTPGYLNVQ